MATRPRNTTENVVRTGFLRGTHLPMKPKPVVRTVPTLHALPTLPLLGATTTEPALPMAHAYAAKRCPETAPPNTSDRTATATTLGGGGGTLLPNRTSSKNCGVLVKPGQETVSECLSPDRSTTVGARTPQPPQDQLVSIPAPLGARRRTLATTMELARLISPRPAPVTPTSPASGAINAKRDGGTLTLLIPPSSATSALLDGTDPLATPSASTTFGDPVVVVMESATRKANAHVTLATLVSTVLSAPLMPDT